MPVGAGFGAFNTASRRARKLPDNPYDRATVVSIYPESLEYRNNTIFPGYWKTEAAEQDDFTLLTFTQSSWWMDRGQDHQLLEVPVNSYTVAESFIRDYCSGLLGCDMSTKMPGLFVVTGVHDKKSILTYKDAVTGETFLSMLEKAKNKQKNYFKELVVLADSLWARTNGNPLTISKDARLAATMLNLKNKPWLGDFQKIEMENCKACGHLVNPLFPVCPNCKTIINADRAKELGLKFAS